MALLDRCAELLGTDMAAVRKAAAKVEPYVRADGTRVWSLMQLVCGHGWVGGPRSAVLRNVLRIVPLGTSDGRLIAVDSHGEVA